MCIFWGRLSIYRGRLRIDGSRVRVDRLRYWNCDRGRGRGSSDRRCSRWHAGLASGSSWRTRGLQGPTAFIEQVVNNFFKNALIAWVARTTDAIIIAMGTAAALGVPEVIVDCVSEVAEMTT